MGAILAAGAVGAAAVLPPPGSPDANLLALIERAKTADSAATDACMAADDLLNETRPWFLQALVWTEADEPHWYGARSGERVSNLDIDFLKKWLPLIRKPDPTAAGMKPIYPTLAFIERAQEIVQTKDAYEAAEQAAKEHPDVLEAQARENALHAQWGKLAKRVATTPAKTPEGLIAEILLIASGYAEDDLDGTYDGILASVAIDAQSLATLEAPARRRSAERQTREWRLLGRPLTVTVAWSQCATTGALCYPLAARRLAPHRSSPGAGLFRA